MPSWAWTAWLVGASVTFAGLETWALTTRREGDTLSETIRRWLGIYPARPGRRVSIAVFVTGVLAFVAWLIPHIIGVI